MGIVVAVAALRKLPKSPEKERILEVSGATINYTAYQEDGSDEDPEIHQPYIDTFQTHQNTRTHSWCEVTQLPSFAIRRAILGLEDRSSSGVLEEVSMLFTRSTSHAVQWANLQRQIVVHQYQAGFLMMQCRKKENFGKQSFFERLDGVNGEAG